MPFSHPLIISQDPGWLAVLQNSCCKSRNAPHSIMWSQKKSKQICQAQLEEAHVVFIFTTHFTYSCAHSQTCTECQVRACHCPAPGLPGVPEWHTWVPAEEPLTTWPVGFLISWETMTYSLAEGEREHLARALRRVIKTMWLSKCLDRNVNMYSTAILKERFSYLLDKGPAIRHKSRPSRSPTC